ncbi:P-loop NTPase family protein [Paenibacillus aestuarii]|uniref:ParA family protein n=1 Tax=Paenibacillus aestuarii TaxID=516965 RepID=A0ABW0KIM7_9BACL|nr:hypothetical protein [Paenibacillus aestuarii]
MNKIQLHVLDQDTVYAERLASYIRSSEYAEQLQVKLFSQAELVQELVNRPQQDGIFLFSDSFMQLFQNKGMSVCIIRLSDTQAVREEKESKFPSVYRFQSLNQLTARIIALYAESGQVPAASQISRHTRIVSIYGSTGSNGKTMTAIHLAKQLCFRGERVFYLSLETVSSATLWLQGDRAGLSQFLYYVKSKPELSGPKLELLKSHDPRWRVDYLSPTGHIREMHDMTGEDVSLLLETLASLNKYDVIIVDLEASVHPRIIKCLELSDHVLWLIMDDLNDLFKTREFMQMLGDTRNVHFLISKYTGKIVNDFSMLGSHVISGYLPYIPEWKSVHAAEQVWQFPLFSEQVYDAYQACLFGSPPRLSEHIGAAG